MKYLLYLLSTTLLAGCSQSKYNEDDFANKTFTGQLIMDSTLTNKTNDMAAGLMMAFIGNAKLKYTFKKPPQGVYTASMGAMLSEEPFQWAIKNDTLKIVTVYKGKSKIKAYKVVDAEDGYTLQSDSVSVRLTAVATPK